ncbi:MAG: DUF2490 domain-containing protein [Cyclobacteriaceae bacterium]
MRLFILTILTFLLLKVCAQERRRMVWEGGVAVDYTIIKNISFNTSLAQRTSFLEDGEGQFTELSFLEFNQFVTKKVHPLLKLSLGYKFRTVEPVEDFDFFEHRITEQAAWTHFERRFRLVSRLRLEQRIRSSTFAHRYRYRLSTDFPLSGDKIDAQEFFLVLSSELLLEIVEKEPNTLENRLSGSLGYAISEKVKADLNFTCRIEDINLDAEVILFITTGLNIKLN